MTESNNLKNSNQPSNQPLSLAERLSRLANTPPTSPAGRKQVNRQKENAVPTELSGLLTKDQLTSLANLEFFGWRLWFIRRPLFAIPKVMLQHEISGIYALLEEDGNLNLEPDLPLRR
jgi:hypothetical protein